MDSSNELNNTQVISQVEILKDDEDIDTTACVCGDISESDNSIESIIIYTEDDIEEAKRLGMSVEEMFEMYDEINNFETDEPECNCEEWPNFGSNNGYEDEGLEESMY